MNIIGFKDWMFSNTTYSTRVISNIISRLNRANRLLPVRLEEVYLFELEHTEEFNRLSVTVRSQLKKAVKLYFEFEKAQGVGGLKE